ncbi:DUF2971 domain-containing protein [Vibrio diazotrophicus]|uniref:DUF2971 domain-containing protein n=1 Tax=Vibrio diazotrophicus TaxID=685 RepID=UPI00142E0094|nr:DUF2971 domain-containing protein [Vibrio diazotrophicus]NIY94286.1 DUF2971 domain-containing protein [Vibrio diazotrophicus]
MNQTNCPNCGFNLSEETQTEQSYRPKFFYKYCPLYSFEEFELFISNNDEGQEEFTITNLFNQVQRFSSRTTFNDAFDSQFNIILPTKSDFKRLKKSVSNSVWRKSFMGELSKLDYQQYTTEVNKLWDSYRIYCMSSCNNNNLMWGHYANCHKGFCIEWDSSKFGKVMKVKYTDAIPKFSLIDLLESRLSNEKRSEFEYKVEKMFSLKISDWGYEQEYRITADRASQNNATHFDGFSLFKFKPDWVKSVIFGAKIDPRFEQYIIENIPYEVEFKKAHINYVKGTIDIKPYK